MNSYNTATIICSLSALNIIVNRAAILQGARASQATAAPFINQETVKTQGPKGVLRSRVPALKMEALLVRKPISANPRLNRPNPRYKFILPSFFMSRDTFRHYFFQPSRPSLYFFASVAAKLRITGFTGLI